MIRGLVLGKFLPPHNGHVHLLETAKKNSDHLTIVVCSLSTEPIDGELRFNWIKELFPDCNVVHLKDDTIPQEPKENPDFWNIWRKALKSFDNEPLDYVFTSEKYGDRLAEELGAKHWLVDLDREAFPISGTKIRNNPIKYWEYIPKIVRSHFMKRVLITGSESCGKSTMAERLAFYFNTIHVPEYAREYLKDMNFNLADLDHIAVMQYQRQQEGMTMPKANRVYFSDTSAIETYIYCNQYFKTSTPTIDKYVALQKDNYDMVLLLTPEVKWVDDGMRNLNEIRWEMHQKYVELLDKLGIKYYTITGDDYQDRTQQAIELTHKLLSVE